MTVSHPRVLLATDGVLVYGRGVGGVLLGSKRDAAVHFNMSRPGRHEFRRATGKKGSTEL